MNLCIRAQGWEKGQEVRSLTQKSGIKGWARGKPGHGPGTTPSCQEIFYIGCWPLTVEMGWVIETHRARPHLNRTQVWTHPGLPASVLVAGSMYAKLERAMCSVNVDVKCEMLSWHWCSDLGDGSRAMWSLTNETQLESTDRGVCSLLFVTCKIFRTSLVVQWARLHAPNAGGLGLIPGQGTRSHMPQLRVHMLQLKILYASTKMEDTACHN